MTTQQKQPSPEVEVVNDPVAFDVINDPLRHRIWLQLATPKSAKEVAAAIGIPPGRIYYHLQLLERHGWIKVVDERKTTTRIERIYGLARRSWLIGDELFAMPGFNTNGMAIGAYQNIFAAFENNLGLIAEHGWPGGTATTWYGYRRIPKDRMIEVLTRVRAVLDEELGAEEATSDSIEGAPLHGVLFMVDSFIELPADRTRSPG